MSDTPSRIAIKFASSRSLPKATVSTQATDQSLTSILGKRRREGNGAQPANGSSHPLGEEDSADDEASTNIGRHEIITTLGGDDAQNDMRRKRVIGRQNDSGWRAEMKARHQRSTIIGGQRSAKTEPKPVAKFRSDMDMEDTTQWGLVVMKQKSQLESQHNEPDVPPGISTRKQQEVLPTRTEDEEAVDALLAEGAAKTPAVIGPSQTKGINSIGSDAPATPTLGDYEDMPVEDFGAALLRGMGWDGDMGPKSKAPVRRPQGLGLGGKPLKDEQLLGAWDNKAGQARKAARPPRVDDYRRQENKRREARSEGRESYKEEREREKGREHEQRYRNGGGDRRVTHGHRSY